MRTIMHVDANSAYLSWTAANLLENGYPIDIRTVPAVIAGNPENRHGIILTKSIAAKKMNIGAGDSLFEARQKCPNLLVFPPEYNLYMACSQAMTDILKEYTPIIQRYSIDECFLDLTETVDRRRSEEVAFEIKEKIKNKLGFTVNVGVSCNKILAKMGSELQKPDRVHTLYPNEIEAKLWPLPVGDLFMVGRATVRKLAKMNINTIGQLAKANPSMLRTVLKSHGTLVYEYANGIDESPVILNDTMIRKGLGNSLTIDHDVETEDEAKAYLLSLSERVGMRLRKDRYMASLVAISIRSGNLSWYGHQRQLDYYIETTDEIYQLACQLFQESWQGEPVRQLGVRLSKLTINTEKQMSLLEAPNVIETEKMNRAVDMVRSRFGEDSIMRGTFANTPYRPIEGGVNDCDFLMMGGYFT